jgi:hypothetical protein
MTEKKQKREVETHPFNPGDKIGIHKAQDVEVERNEGRAPAAKPESEATVGKDGALEFSAAPGTYTISNIPDKDDDETPIRHLTVTVKD